MRVAGAISVHRLNQFGIIPRTAPGLLGIPVSPLLHVSLSHALLNTIPLVVLGAMIAAYSPRSFIKVSIAVALVGGIGVWLFARAGSHVGASGLIFGYLGYVIARAFFERKMLSILLACVAIFLFGGLIYGVIPTSAGISWEAHLLGFLAGAGFARHEH